MAWSDEDLKVCVERLAAPAERQLAWVRNLGSFPSLDELALDFDDEFRRVQGSAEVRGRAGVAEALSALDRQLSRMSGPANAELWVPEALNGEEWARVRKLAHCVLVEWGD